MFECREDLLFVLKTSANSAGVQLALEHFDGDRLLKFPVAARRQINRAHSAETDFALDFVGTDLLSEQLVGRILVNKQSG